MTVTLEARTRCAICGCWLPIIACPPMRVNKRSVRQLPGGYLTCHPGSCPECRTREHGEMYRATAWRLTAQSWREVDAYRQRRWPS